MSSPELKKLLPHRRPPDPSAAVRLFCLPFAGGGAANYREWSAALPAKVDVCAVELPGRGMRLRERTFDELDPLADQLASALAVLCDRPVVIFGHSLGARVGFALARRIPEVAGLIASAAPAAHLPPRRQRLHLTRSELLQELAALGGTPPEILADTEMMDAFLPTFRSDFKLLACMASQAARVSCPILALAAPDDREVVFEDTQRWAELTTAEFRHASMTGGHFYLQTSRPIVLEEIRSAISTWL
jgi:medium-chain acyl-[acyl-carrier-protein] hydrolase